MSREKISIYDNFFELGGHSLKATRLASQIQKEFGVRIGLQELFTHVVLADQAVLISASSQTILKSIPVLPLQADYALSSSQQRLWILSQFEEGNLAYNIPGACVFEGAFNASLLELAFQDLIFRHEVLRTVFRENASGEIRQYILSAEELGFSFSYHEVFGLNEADCRCIDCCRFTGCF